MAIYDNNGTVNNEIMAIYDNDGTTNYLICSDNSMPIGTGLACQVRGNTGTTHTGKSSTVTLPAGTYSYSGLSTMYTYPNNSYGCRFRVFVNGSEKVNKFGNSTWSEFLGNLYIVQASTSGTLTLTEDSSVYIQVDMTLSATYPSLSQSSLILTKTS